LAIDAQPATRYRLPPFLGDRLPTLFTITAPRPSLLPTPPIAHGVRLQRLVDSLGAVNIVCHQSTLAAQHSKRSARAASDNSQPSCGATCPALTGTAWLPPCRYTVFFAQLVDASRHSVSITVGNRLP
jgi:hypothetical protein